MLLPHHIFDRFAQIPPIETLFAERGAEIRACILDKDNCFAAPHELHVHPSCRKRFDALCTEFHRNRLIVVSNTAGTTSVDPAGLLAKQVEDNVGVRVLSHSTPKPGCGAEIMDFLQSTEGPKVEHAAQVVVIGDRLLTDVMLANMMGAWGIWLRKGVLEEKRGIVICSLDLYWKLG